MNAPNPAILLAAGALVILGALGGALLIHPIPAPNAQSVTFILGALAGALTLQGAGKPPNPPKDPP